ncbi:hypothetical protein [Nocardiopsis deserti]|uniref:hypothetical protein n=1 Tax=Nocardiopsis deserti TaxID=2605988 RepID=UPI001CC26498|nr:hypothetical protein [Nocardiopsis deserti]
MWAVALVLLAAASLGGYAAAYAYDLWSTESLLREQRAAEAEVDQERAPFTSSITYDTSVPHNFKFVLDRPLTAQEGETLRATPAREAGDFLQSLGGRLVRYGSSLYPESPDAWKWERPGGDLPDATVFTMNLLSTRTSQLSIVDMTPVNVSCSEPTAVTVVEFPPQGESTYPGVIVDLAEDDPELYVSNEGPDQGLRYFSHRRIDLGGGTDPGGLRVEALVDDQSCEWEIRARYTDARENTDEVILRDGDQPFFAEALPAQPQQYWLASALFPHPDGSSFMPCHEMRNESACTNHLGSTG